MKPSTSLMINQMSNHLQKSSDLKKQLASDEHFNKVFSEMGKAMSDALKAGHKILIAGNGGSASQSQHFAAELVGRYKLDRAPQAAISLAADVATITSLSNDFGYEKVFSKQVEALSAPKDIFLGLSTSGNSANIVEALKTAHSLGLQCFGLVGNDGGLMRGLCDMALIIPESDTPLIQEVHLSVLHMWADMIEQSL